MLQLIGAFIFIKGSRNTKFLNKKYLIIKEEVNVARTIRKPKRYEIIWFWYQCFYNNRDIKEDKNNHRHPATMRD